MKDRWPPRRELTQLFVRAKQKAPKRKFQVGPSFSSGCEAPSPTFRDTIEHVHESRQDDMSFEKGRVGSEERFR